MDLDTNNQPVWVWRAFDHLDVNRHPYLFPDWTHSNAVVYEPDGSLLLSMRHQSWILKIDYANGSGGGDVLWRLGPGGDFTLSDSDPAQWFYNQHYPNLLQIPVRPTDSPVRQWRYPTRQQRSALHKLVTAAQSS